MSLYGEMIVRLLGSHTVQLSVTDSPWHFYVLLYSTVIILLFV